MLVSYGYPKTFTEEAMSDEEIMEKVNEMSLKLDGAKSKKDKMRLYEEFAEAFFSRKAYEAASGIYQMLLEMDPSKKKTAEYYVKLGDIEAAKQSYSESLEYYKNALALYKKNNEIKQKIGDILLESNLYNLAEQVFKEILDSDKNSDYAKMKLGSIYYRQKRYSKALRYYEDVNQNRYSKEVVYNMSLCYRSLNKTAKAVKLISGYVNTNPSADMHVLLGILYADTDQFNEAEEQFLEAIKLDESNFSSYVYLAAIYLENGDIQKSEQMLYKANLLNSYTAAVDMMYARVSYKKGRLYEARRYAANAVLKAKTAFLKQQAQRMLDYLNEQQKYPLIPRSLF
jgi:tetratricopeptide (TPR) repeat protein